MLRKINLFFLNLLLCSSFLLQASSSKKQGFLNSAYSYFFEPAPEKTKKPIKQQKKRNQDMVQLKKNVHDLTQNVTQLKQELVNSQKAIIPSKETHAQNWLTLQKKISDTGYYNASGLELLDSLDSELWYAQASWPFVARNFLKKEYLEVEIGASFADRAFFGDTPQKISSLIFNKEKIELQDILLISKLLKNERLSYAGGTPANNVANVYKHFATQEIDACMSYNSQTITLNYARQWLDGMLTTGIQLPIVRKSHRLTLSVPRDDTLQQNFYNNTYVAEEARKNFLIAHPDGIEGFIKTVLQQKNIDSFTRDHNDNIGNGDISFFINGHYDFKYCTEGHLGFKVTLPVAKTRKLNTLWAPDLGNGGFVAFTGHAGFQWHSESSLLNPHIFSELDFFMISSVDRRVPRMRTYEGSNPGPLLTPRYDSTTQAADGFLLYGHQVNFDTNKHFAEPEVTVKEFADTVTRVHLRPGVVWHTRIGNLFSDIIIKNLSCNLYYDALLKGEDTVGFYDQTDDYLRHTLTENTNQHAHSIGGTIHYQCDETWRVNFGFEHLFAGKNIMQTTMVFFSFSAEF